MQDSSKVIMSGAGRVPALPPAPAAVLLVMTPETDSKCVCVFFKKLVLVRTRRLES